MARPERPERSRSALPLRQLSRFCYLMNSDLVFGTHSQYPMRRDADCLMLATRQRHNPFQASWSEIKSAAADADPALGLARIQATAKYRRIFDSVKTPP